MNTFTELMANTYKHASSEEGKHHWWVSVTKDKDNQIEVKAYPIYMIV